jgi:hypothetical protein
VHDSLQTLLFELLVERNFHPREWQLNKL